jgi:hypothetical protein
VTCYYTTADASEIVLRGRLSFAESALTSRSVDTRSRLYRTIKHVPWLPHQHLAQDFP